MCCIGRIVARWRCLGCGPAAGGGAVGADAIKYDAIIAARFALASTAATAASGISLGGPPPSARDAAAGQLCSRLWNFHSVHSELHAVNAMGDGHFAISLAAYGAQTRPSMATFICMCCGDGRTWRCGHAFITVQRYLASKKAPGFCTAARSTILTLMLLRGKPLWRVCSVLQVVWSCIICCRKCCCRACIIVL